MLVSAPPIRKKNFCKGGSKTRPNRIHNFPDVRGLQTAHIFILNMKILRLRLRMT